MGKRVFRLLTFPLLQRFTVLVPFFHSTTLTKSLAQANASIITNKVYRNIDAACNKYSQHEFNIRPANILAFVFIVKNRQQKV